MGAISMEWELCVLTQRRKKAKRYRNEEKEMITKPGTGGVMRKQSICRHEATMAAPESGGGVLARASGAY